MSSRKSQATKPAVTRHCARAAALLLSLGVIILLWLTTSVHAIRILQPMPWEQKTICPSGEPCRKPSMIESPKEIRGSASKPFKSQRYQGTCFWRAGYGTICEENGTILPLRREIRITLNGESTLVRDKATSVTPWWAARRSRAISNFTIISR